ncbi:adenylate kinase [Spirulina sp. CS-785/01]|uniref:adenylate kinase n=1 Tax=Spirulina sp. CS-785/01 TaxID=3021716 RepID=UPI00232FE882|nr:adenylate kinase [Spirulina sp. CS-785/01]MDB9313090.1 adenylate kinase [Spirulina sp. CS-785/01]
MRLIFLGSPGVGKGTFAKEVMAKKQIPQISTGDLLRNAMKLQTPLGIKIEGYMKTGELVPDELVLEILSERIHQEDCQNGFILDGFPRTIPQAESLEQKPDLAVDKVLKFNAEKEVIIRRLSNRRVCQNCGATYHLINFPPKVSGVCDVCGGTVGQRDDDKPEAIERRLVEYHQKTAPLVNFYQQRGLLVVVNANGEKHETMPQVWDVLES